jgi:hypothetical protein
VKKRILLSQIPDQLPAPTVIVAPTLTRLFQLQASRELKAVDLARFLAAAQFDPAYRGPNHSVMIPTEVVSMIGKRLIAPTKWNAASVEAAAQKASSWQEQADDIWKRHPRFSKTRVAKLIDPITYNTIRLKITPPK